MTSLKSFAWAEDVGVLYNSSTQETEIGGSGVPSQKFQASQDWHCHGREEKSHESRRCHREQGQ